jgi:hypothetical protein
MQNQLLANQQMQMMQYGYPMPYGFHPLLPQGQALFKDAPSGRSSLHPNTRERVSGSMSKQMNPSSMMFGGQHMYHPYMVQQMLANPSLQTQLSVQAQQTSQLGANPFVNANSGYYFPPHGMPEPVYPPGYHSNQFNQMHGL